MNKREFERRVRKALEAKWQKSIITEGGWGYHRRRSRRGGFMVAWRKDGTGLSVMTTTLGVLPFTMLGSSLPTEQLRQREDLNGYAETLVEAGFNVERHFPGVFEHEQPYLLVKEGGDVSEATDPAS